MRILIIHNRYRQPGGEDVVVESELELLRSKGHEVHLYEKSNDNVHGLRGAFDSIWSGSVRQEIEEVIKKFKPDIAHIHNVFHTISPAVYRVIASHGVPIVQTLHNFRFFCIRGTFEREGKICQRCLGHSVWNGVRYKCYRDSRSASILLATNLQIHRILQTFEKYISHYIVLNKFCRKKFISCGLSEKKISVKPNFIDIHDSDTQNNREGGLYVGRMATEKGIAVLTEALSRSSVPFKTIGDGPEAHLLQRLPQITMNKSVPREKVFVAMRNAEYLVMPSIWYETFGLVMVEAFACRLPVIASDIGAMAELVEDGKTGLLFKTGDASDLAEKLKWADAHPEQMREMGDTARNGYEQLFTSDKNYEQLLDIYEKVTDASTSRHTEKI